MSETNYPAGAHTSTVQKMLSKVQPMPRSDKIIAGPNASGEIISTTGEVIAGGEQEPKTPPGTVTITQHPDGYPLKFTIVPNTDAEAAPKFALFDGAGVTHAVAHHANVAAMICTALKLVGDASKEVEAMKKATAADPAEA